MCVYTCIYSMRLHDRFRVCMCVLDEYLSGLSFDIRLKLSK